MRSSAAAVAPGGMPRDPAAVDDAAAAIGGPVAVLRPAAAAPRAGLLEIACIVGPVASYVLRDTFVSVSLAQPHVDPAAAVAVVYIACVLARVAAYVLRDAFVSGSVAQTHAALAAFVSGIAETSAPATSTLMQPV